MDSQVRIGKVSQISGRQVRVLFPDTGVISGWLTVTKHAPTVGVSTSVSAKASDTSITITTSASSSATVYEWMPAVGDTVLCLYTDGFNSDGYVVGGL